MDKARSRQRTVLAERVSSRYKQIINCKFFDLRARPKTRLLVELGSLLISFVNRTTKAVLIVRHIAELSRAHRARRRSPSKKHFTCSQECCTFGTQTSVWQVQATGLKTDVRSRRDRRNGSACKAIWLRSQIGEGAWKPKLFSKSTKNPFLGLFLILMNFFLFNYSVWLLRRRRLLFIRENLLN